MKAILKRLLQLVLGAYEYYFIYTDVGGGRGPNTVYQIETVARSAILASGEPLMRAQADYAGEGAYAYACLWDGRIVALCFYWFGERYRSRNFWPLAEGEAKLVQVIALPEVRCKGVATALIQQSAVALKQRGVRRLYARVWHSNKPSLRAFEQAGWRRVARVVTVNPLRLARPFRIELGP